ncbi:MAG: class A beta-lactamase [Pseudomonadota bacterium]
MDRRVVLGGLSALGLIGCARQGEASAPQIAPAPSPEPLDLSALEMREGGRIGVFARDLDSNRSLTWRGDERFVYCSTFKMYLAAATLLRVQSGEEQLDRQIPITRADMINHAPVSEPAIGSTLSVQRMMQAVVEVSDNPAANLLLKALGGIAPMQAFYRGIGDQTTRADRFEPEMNRLDGDKDTILPAQSAANLHSLFIDDASPLTRDNRGRLLDWMFASLTGAARIKAGAPQGWRVAHKTGTGGYGPTNDIGILYPPSGEPIVIAVYYHAATDDPKNEGVIAEATRLALTSLGRA